MDVVAVDVSTLEATMISDPDFYTGYKLGGFGLTLEVTLMLETTLEASLEERLDKLDLSGSNRIDVH